MKAELERIRDQLKCSLNMGGLKGAAEWAVGELDRLLAGAQNDYDAVRARVLFLEDAISGWAEAIQFSDLSVEAGYGDEMKSALAAAPTVKTERVEDFEVFWNSELRDELRKSCARGWAELIWKAATAAARFNFAHEASLSAAGSAVEEVASRDHDPINAPYLMFCLNKWWPCSERQLNAARDRNYPIIDLSARQPAPERVSVPKLAGLQSVNHQLGIVALSFKSSEQTQEAVRELRALLSSHGRGEA